MERLSFITERQALRAREEFGTPLFVYDEASLRAAARSTLTFPNAFGMTVRFAMKALPSAAVLRIFHEEGLHIDASSAFEVERAMRAGIPAENIQITAQQLAHNLPELVKMGVRFNACSLHQLREFGKITPGAEVCVRINPGLGSGHSNRTNVGGPSASFGIWHEHLDEVLTIEREFGLHITRMHTHIGSGADPVMWEHCARMSLGIAARLPEVMTLNLGGGFKVGRMQGEPSTDLHDVGRAIAADFEEFARQHGRNLKLEIEPGTYLVANAGAVLTSVMDVVDTGANGYTFIKTDTGMTEVTRPSLYGAQHPIVLVPGEHRAERVEREYLVAGHCCESGDILTPEPGNPEGLATRTLHEAFVGDLLVIGGAGAYCSGMSTKNYNSFPEAAEVLLTCEGELRLIRKRQTLDQMLANEI
jgi:diaminopimelate decarboxylase